MEPVRCLDLFTGIGGFALGLHGITKVVGYCEIDEHCKQSLKANIEKGLLEKAPVFHDVTKISESELSHLDIEMITAGSPCQDLSGANPYAKGIHGPKSKLIFEVVRIVHTLPSVQYVLLENSPAIVHKGLDDVLVKFREMNFNYIWTRGFATEVGSLHKRQRWMCLLYRTGSIERLRQLMDDYTVNKFERVEPVRVVPNALAYKSLCEMFGNAIVPEFAKYMLYTLLQQIDNSTERCVSNTSKVVAWNVDEGHVEMTRCVANSMHQDLQLKFKHVDGSQIERKMWATPRRSAWWKPRKLTILTIKYIVAQIMMESDTLAYIERMGYETRHIGVNPEFIEWLMMYPSGWLSS
jgi:site-specific DNA-cytosine methylase